MLNKKQKPREWLVTDSCFYMQKPPKGYNDDPRRTPHSIMLVDPNTGTIKNLPSGSKIIIVEEKHHEPPKLAGAPKKHKKK